MGGRKEVKQRGKDEKQERGKGGGKNHPETSHVYFSLMFGPIENKLTVLNNEVYRIGIKPWLKMVESV